MLKAKIGRESGFTLVEVMIALAIATALGLMTVFGEGSLMRNQEFQQSVDRATGLITLTANQIQAIVSNDPNPTPNPNQIIYARALGFVDGSNKVLVRTILANCTRLDGSCATDNTGNSSDITLQFSCAAPGDGCNVGSPDVTLPWQAKISAAASCSANSSMVPSPNILWVIYWRGPVANQFGTKAFISSSDAALLNTTADYTQDPYLPGNNIGGLSSVTAGKSLYIGLVSQDGTKHAIITVPGNNGQPSRIIC